ncbi:SAM-dependent methyltransferase [Winogradskya humida]|uniref:SAM-dependent methyltransferase n=1 Tax=Winogradskya humida TaxID=113566 RepID=UPI001941505F|nr:class I SAM-dependent methyltransferase [Actinoplanes humidus]
MHDDDLVGFLAAAGAGLAFNAPLGERRAVDLVRRLAPSGPGWRALDLGCGNGELLERLCETYDLSGDGVELKPVTRISERVTFHIGDAARWDRAAELVVNVGAGHVWGGAPQALAALHRLTAPGGKLLFADGFYRRPPSADVREMFGDLPGLNAMAQAAVEAGFRPLHIAESALGEWDDFESDWRAGIERLGTPQARVFADQRRDGYLDGYRGVVGFGWLVLTPA